MLLLDYVAEPQRGFTDTEQRVLESWYQEFESDPALQLIRRNFDWESVRDDIDHRIWEDFLREIARYHRSGFATPTEVMDAAYRMRPSYFSLRGLPLSVDAGIEAGTKFVHCIRAEHFVKYNCYPVGLPIGNVDGTVKAIQAGKLSGEHLVGSGIGAHDRPVWVAAFDDVDPDRPGLPPSFKGDRASRLRDFLGLKHIESGHLVELRYDSDLLGLAGVDLRAPTVLDAVAGGAENWIFAKRASPGGPGWGHAVDLESCGPGAREAVHASLTVSPPVGVHLAVAYAGVIGRNPSPCDFQQLLRNLETP